MRRNGSALFGFFLLISFFATTSYSQEPATEIDFEIGVPLNQGGDMGIPIGADQYADLGVFFLDTRVGSINDAYWTIYGRVDDDILISGHGAFCNNGSDFAVSLYPRLQGVVPPQPWAIDFKFIEEIAGPQGPEQIELGMVDFFSFQYTSDEFSPDVVVTIYDGYGGTGNVLASRNLLGNADDIHPDPRCPFDTWSDQVIPFEGVGRSVTFHGEPLKFLIDDLSWNRQRVVDIELRDTGELTGGVLLVPEGVGAPGEELPVGLSAPPRNGETIVVEVVRESGDEDLAVFGSNFHTFDDDNGFQFHPFRFEATEDDGDVQDGQAVFLIRRATGSPGSSTAHVNPLRVTVQEVDDELALDLRPAQATQGTTIPNAQQDQGVTLIDTNDVLSPGPGFPIFALPAAGKQFDQWTIDPEGIPAVIVWSVPEIDPVTGSATSAILESTPGHAVMKAVFKDMLELTIESDPGGSTDPTGAIDVVTDAPRDISATADPGYRFVRWEGSGAQFGDPNLAATTVAIGQSTTIRAVFEASVTPQFVLDLDSPPGSPNAHLIPEGGRRSIRVRLSNDPEGTVHTVVRWEEGDRDLSVLGDSTLLFDGTNMDGTHLWQRFQSVELQAREDDGDGQSDSASFTVRTNGGDSPHINDIQTVTFVVMESDDDIQLVVNTAGNGTTNPAGSLLVDTSGSNTQLPFAIEAMADSGHRFDHWSGDVDHLQDNSASTQLITNLDTTITAHFAEGSDSEFVITVNHVGNGTTTPHGETVVQAGNAITVQANAGDGYRFAGWTGDTGQLGDTNQATQTFTPTQNANLIANFVDEDADTATLTVVKTGMGTVNPARPVIIEKGRPFQIQAFPDSDYQFNTWTSNGGVLAMPNEATTTVTINGNTTVTAIFVETGSETALLTVTREGTGTTQPTGSREIPTDVPYPISASPGTGNRFVQWTGQTTGVADTGSEITEITISGDTEIEAVFELEGGGNRILRNGPLVINENQSGSFNLTLLDQPQAPVTLEVLQIDGDNRIALCQGTQTSFTLNQNNYNIPNLHSFEVCVQDLSSQVERNFRVRQFPASQTDPLDHLDFTVRGVTGDPMGNPGFVVNPDSLVINEGGTKSITVSLSADPGDNYVNWHVLARGEAGDDPNIVVVSGSGTHGGALNAWDNPKTVTFRANQDQDLNDDTAVFVISELPDGSSTLHPPDAFVTVGSIDDDGQDPPTQSVFFLVEQTPITVREGNSGEVGVRLSAKPDSNFVASISHHMGDSSVVSQVAELEFSMDNWSVFQPITVDAIEDNSDIENVQVRFLIEQTGSVQNIPDFAFAVNTIDNDYAIGLAVDGEQHHGQTIPAAGTAVFGDSNQSPPFIQAIPDPGYLFSHWSGDVGILDDLFNPQPTLQIAGPDPTPNQYSLTAHFISEADVQADIAIFNSLLDAMGFALSCIEGVDPALQQHNSLADPSQFLNDVNPDFNRSGPAHILPHSGQEVLEQADLTIAGRDHVTQLIIKRRHVTRNDVQRSPFGPAWAFNYDHWFEQRVDGHLDMHSYGRRDLFIQDPEKPNLWIGTGGRLGRLTYGNDDTALLRTFTGTKIKFLTSGSKGNIIGRISEIISPNGNTLRFTYQTGGQLFQKKLLGITESFGRSIEFHYEDDQFTKGVTRIVDTTDPDAPRQVVYRYNPQGQLLSVTSPAVTQTGHNDFPNGKTSTYTYLNHPRLSNAITSLTAPNQNASSPPGPSRLSWTYNTDAGNNPLFGFVTSHTVGDPGGLAGGTYHYAYQIPDPIGNPGPNHVAMRTTVTDRRGTQTLLEYNRRGQLLKERIEARFREDHDFFERGFTYNRDGDLTASENPLLGTLSEIHPDPDTTPRHMHANERFRTLVPDSRGGDQAEIRQEIIYEPIYNKPFKIIDPRGLDPDSGFQADAVTTLYVYDYMENIPAALAKFAPQLGLTSMELQDLFDEAGIRQFLAGLGLPIQGGDLNEDGLTHQDCGNLIRVFHPTTTLPEQAGALGLPSAQVATELFQYNPFGQVIRAVDAEENTTDYYYFGANDPDGDGVIDIPGADSQTGGFLSHITRDSRSGSATRNSGSGASPVRQTTRFQYTRQRDGQFPANHRGIPTAIVDPRGVKDIFLINALDQNIVTFKAFEVVDDAGGTLEPFAYESRTYYDHNNNPILTYSEDRETQNPLDRFIRTRVIYDILDHPIHTIADTGPENLRIKTRYLYDASENLIEKKVAPGKMEQTIEQWTYDSRDQLVRHTRGVQGDHGEEAVFQYVVDLDGNVLQTIDSDGDVSTNKYDGYNRLVETIDRVGNRTLYEYDAASQVVRQEKWGPIGVLDLTSDPAAQPHVQLAETAFHFDERGRNFRIDKSLFHYSDREYGPLHDGDLDPGDGLVSDVKLFDRLGRTIASIDADGDLFQLAYDGLSRQVSSLDPEGNQVDRAFDANGNPLVTSQLEMGPGGGSQSFVTHRYFDALNRLEEMVEPNGQSTLFHYDSRNNRIATSDPLGNEVSWLYDRLNRLVEKRIYLKDGGENATATNHDESIVTQWQWDDLGRLVARVDGNGARTEYQYDDLNRKIATLYPDGLSETWVYNGDGELQSHLRRNDYLETWHHDSKGRPVQLEIKAPGRQIHVGTALKRWAYDGLDRRTMAFDDNAGPFDEPVGNFVLVSTWFDSLGRTLFQAQALGLETADPITLGQVRGHSLAGKFSKGGDRLSGRPPG